LRGYYTELTDETFNNAKMKMNKKGNSEKSKRAKNKTKEDKQKKRTKTVFHKTKLQRINKK